MDDVNLANVRTRMDSVTTIKSTLVLRSNCASLDKYRRDDRPLEAFQATQLGVEYQ